MHLPMLYACLLSVTLTTKLWDVSCAALSPSISREAHTLLAASKSAWGLNEIFILSHRPGGTVQWRRDGASPCPMCLFILIVTLRVVIITLTHQADISSPDDAPPYLRFLDSRHFLRAARGCVTQKSPAVSNAASTFGT